MVKIKVKLVLLGVIVLVVSLLLNTLVHASSGQNLQITNVDVQLSSKTLRNLSNGDTIPEDARPDHIVEFRVEVRNNHTLLQDFKIRDITVKTTIEGIDDGADMEIESDRFDLRADTQKKSFFEFTIPLQVREDSYNVLITAEGQDEDGTIEIAQQRLKLEVVNDNHMLKIIKASLTPTELSCNRKNVQLAATILNIGDLDEEGVSVQIYNKELELNINDKIGSLLSRPNEPESKFSKTYAFNVPKGAEAGNYPITLKVLYNDDRASAESTSTLIVNNCASAEIPEGAKPAAGPSVELIIPPEVKPKAPVVQPEIPAGTVITQENFLSNNAFVIAIVFAAAAIVGIAVAVSLFRRKG